MELDRAVEMSSEEGAVETNLEDVAVPFFL